MGDECLRTAANAHNSSEVLFRLCANTELPPSIKMDDAVKATVGKLFNS